MNARCRPGVDAILARARPEIRALKAYVSARSDATPARIFLNANENPESPPGVPESMALNRYPEPQPEALVAALAGRYGVDVGSLLLTRGSDEGIDLLVRAFCRAYEDAVIVTPPTFGMYAVCAGIQGAAVRSVPLNADFELDEAGIAGALDGRAKILFLCSPGNPGGKRLPDASIERMLRACEGNTLVVVDEAYGEFAGVDSWSARLAEFPNLVVLRTLSKLYGLAGARLGITLAAPEIIALLQRILPPYPIPSPVVSLALRALDPAHEDVRRREVLRIADERRRMAAALSAMPAVLRVYPSDANFLLVVCHDAEHVLAACDAAGIRIRDRRSDLAGAVRITLGRDEENSALLEVLSRVPA